MIGCTEQFPSAGNSVLFDNTSNPPWPTIFDGCSFLGTNTAGTTAGTAMVQQTWMQCFAKFTNCHFQKGSQTSQWVYVNGSNGNTATQLIFDSCSFGYTGGAPGTKYSTNGATLGIGAEYLVFRNCYGINPAGTQAISVPATTVATTPLPFDAIFYVTAAAGGGVTLAISGGPTITVPASAVVPVLVPAGQTLTPTYTSAPTWVVEGL
jgi:hypothetical protein